MHLQSRLSMKKSTSPESVQASSFQRGNGDAVACGGAMHYGTEAIRRRPDAVGVGPKAVVLGLRRRRIAVVLGSPRARPKGRRRWQGRWRTRAADGPFWAVGVGPSAYSPWAP